MILLNYYEDFDIQLRACKKTPVVFQIILGVLKRQRRSSHCLWTISTMISPKMLRVPLAVFGERSKEP